MNPLFEDNEIKLSEKEIQQEINYYFEIFSKAIKNKLYNDGNREIPILTQTPLIGTEVEKEKERLFQLDNNFKQKIKGISSEKRRLTKLFNSISDYIKKNIKRNCKDEDLNRIIETTKTLVKKDYKEDYEKIKQKRKNYLDEIEKIKNKIKDIEEGKIKNMEEKNIDYSKENNSEVYNNETIVIPKENANYSEENQVFYYTNLFQGTNFFVHSNKLNLKTDRGYVAVSNFIPIVTKKIIFNNGNDKEIKYLIKALLLDKNKMLEEIEITPQEYNSFKFILGSNWDKDAIIEPGNSNFGRLKYIAQYIARTTMKEQEVYTNTGFKRIGKDLVFLYHNGIIGNGDNINVDLSQDELERYCFTDKEFDPKQALNRSYSMLSISTYDITIPLIATIYLAPLTTLLQEEGIHPDFILMYVAKTGSRKSSIVAAGISHFGNFTRDTLPASFENTVSAIERKAFILKDVPIVLDDLKPAVDMKQQLGVLGKAYGIFGDRSSKSRINPNLKNLRPTYTARGLCIVTSEIIPDLPESRLLRSIIVNIKKKDINLEKLTAIQNNKEELAYAMKIFIKWIIDNETSIRSQAKQIMQELQKKQNNSLHGRTNEAINVMMIGFIFFLEFMLKNDIINENEYYKMKNKAYTTLKDIANNQTKELEDTSPVTRFYNAIEESLSTGKIYLLDYETGKPVMDTKGQMVGFLDKKENEYYFYESTIYNEIQKFYNHKFVMSRLSLWRELQNAGLLHITEKQKRKTVQRVNPITKHKEKVIAVKIHYEHDK